MADEKMRLIQALTERERVAGFFNNLEKLNVSEEIDPALYSSKKQQYSQRLSELSFQIAQIKESLKSQSAEIERVIAARKLELGGLDVAFKVGEMPPAKYDGPARKLRAEIAGLEQELAALKAHGEANSLVDISVKPAQTIAGTPLPVSAGHAGRDYYRTTILSAFNWLWGKVTSSVAALCAGVGSGKPLGEGQGSAPTAGYDVQAALQRGSERVEQAYLSLAARVTSFKVRKSLEKSEVTDDNVIRLGPATGTYEAKSQAAQAAAPPVETHSHQGAATAGMRSLKVMKMEFSSTGGAGSSFSWVTEPLSVVRLAALIISALIFIAVVFMPWIILPGYGVSVTEASPWIGAGCILLFLIYTAAVFIFNREIRSFTHIGVAVAGIAMWANFRFVIFPPIAAFAISPGDMEGEGLLLFSISVVLGIVVGIMELFPSVDRRL
jgi:hypothetical protein